MNRCEGRATRAAAPIPESLLPPVALPPPAEPASAPPLFLRHPTGLPRGRPVPLDLPPAGGVLRAPAAPSASGGARPYGNHVATCPVTMSLQWRQAQMRPDEGQHSA